IAGTTLSIGFAGAALLIVRFLFGCGEAGAYPNLNRITAIWFPFRERAFAQGAVWMCARLGGAVAPLAITWLSTRFGWRQAFWIFGMVGVVWALVFYMWFRDTPGEKKSCNNAERALIRTSPPGTRVRSEGETDVHLAWSTLLLSTNAWMLGLAAFF